MHTHSYTQARTASDLTRLSEDTGAGARLVPASLSESQPRTAPSRHHSNPSTPSHRLQHTRRSSNELADTPAGFLGSPVASLRQWRSSSAVGDGTTSAPRVSSGSPDSSGDAANQAAGPPLVASTATATPSTSSSSTLATASSQPPPRARRASSARRLFGNVLATLTLL
jgi:hypothetical protein